MKWKLSELSCLYGSQFGLYYDKNLKFAFLDSDDCYDVGPISNMQWFQST